MKVSSLAALAARLTRTTRVARWASGSLCIATLASIAAAQNTFVVAPTDPGLPNTTYTGTSLCCAVSGLSGMPGFSTILVYPNAGGYAGIDLGVHEFHIQGVEQSGQFPVIDGNVMPPVCSGPATGITCTMPPLGVPPVGIKIDNMQTAQTIIENITIQNFQTLDDCNNILGNAPDAGKGAGVFVGQGSSPILLNLTIKNNEASIGGGVYCEDSEAQIINCLFENNRALDCISGGLLAGVLGKGGGLYAIRSPITVTNSTFRFNKAGLRGAGVCIENIADELTPNAIDLYEVRFEGCTFDQNGNELPGNMNERPVNGGGIHIEADIQAQFDDCPFVANAADYGGGASVGRFNSQDTVGPQAVFDYCPFLANDGGTGGGGIFVYSGRQFRCLNSQFEGNTAVTGGGIHVETGPFFFSQGLALVKDCLFTGNIASSFGGGLYSLLNHPLVEHCTFNMNQGSDGGGLYVDEVNPLTPVGITRVTNCILWGNTASGQPLWQQNMSFQGPNTPGHYEALLEVTSCDWEGSSGGTAPPCPTCIDTDPLWEPLPVPPVLITNQPNEEYFLQTTSPCVNAGTAGVLPVGSGTTRTDLAPDILDPTYDMGFHYNGPQAPRRLDRLTQDIDELTVSMLTQDPVITFTMETLPYSGTGEQYFYMFGSFSTSPGVPLEGTINGPWLPTTVDLYFDALFGCQPGLLASPAGSPCIAPGLEECAFVYDCDRDGFETMTLTLPLDVMQELTEPLTLYHAFGVYDLFDIPNVLFQYTSNSQVLKIDIYP